MPVPNTKLSKFKLFLLNWACIFPGVMLLNVAANWLLANWNPPEWVLTLIVTGVLTFGIVYFVGPWLEHAFRDWLRKH
jgi:antibiotic biosynthesis monooxygenase (ABM) superfamily enzyme